MTSLYFESWNRVCKVSTFLSPILIINNTCDEKKNTFSSQLKILQQLPLAPGLKSKVLLTGTLLLANVTSIAAPAPAGLHPSLLVPNSSFTSIPAPFLLPVLSSPLLSCLSSHLQIQGQFKYHLL